MDTATHFEPCAGSATGIAIHGARDAPAAMRDTHGAMRLRAPPRLAAALRGGASRSARCRALRALARAGRHREAALLALVHALGDRDPEIRIAALDGLFDLARAVPRLRGRVRDVLHAAALAPSRSTAMHAAVLADALDLPAHR